jgi:hypothetical protein
MVRRVQKLPLAKERRVFANVPLPLPELYVGAEAATSVLPVLTREVPANGVRLLDSPTLFVTGVCHSVPVPVTGMHALLRARIGHAVSPNGDQSRSEQGRQGTTWDQSKDPRLSF